jgi:predicted solute-binding protein
MQNNKYWEAVRSAAATLATMQNNGVLVTYNTLQEVSEHFSVAEKDVQEYFNNSYNWPLV